MAGQRHCFRVAQTTLYGPACVLVVDGGCSSLCVCDVCVGCCVVPEAVLPRYSVNTAISDCLLFPCLESLACDLVQQALLLRMSYLD